jgi:hypothetical protein
MSSPGNRPPPALAALAGIDATRANYCVGTQRGEGRPEVIQWDIDSTSTIGGHAVSTYGAPRVIATDDGGSAVEFSGNGDGLLIETNPVEGMRAFTAEVVFCPYRGGPKEQRFFHMDSGGGNRVLLETRSNGWEDPQGHAGGMRGCALAPGEWFADVCVQSPAPRTGVRRSPNLAIQFATNCTHQVDEWHTLSVVIDGPRLIHYVNGVREDTSAFPRAHAPHELPFPYARYISWQEPKSG